MQDKTIDFYMTEKNLKEVIVTKVRNQAKTKKKYATSFPQKINFKM